MSREVAVGGNVRTPVGLLLESGKEYERLSKSLEKRVNVVPP